MQLRNTTPAAPSLSTTRERLGAVLARAPSLVTVEIAGSALGVDRLTAAKTLARWASQGWLRRLRRGLYVPVPLGAGKTDQALEDPWTLVPQLFDPAYIGGAIAAHHWDLTEQMFRTIFVYSSRPLRQRQHQVDGVTFEVRHLSSEKLFGTRPAWRGRTKLQISDVERTVFDLLADPSAGGGIRHVSECLEAYLRRPDADLNRLIDYADRLANGAVFKRLGFLVEQQGGPPELIAACARRLTKGNAKLGPGISSPRLVRRWRLWIPEGWRNRAGKK